MLCVCCVCVCKRERERERRERVREWRYGDKHIFSNAKSTFSKLLVHHKCMNMKQKLFTDEA